MSDTRAALEAALADDPDDAVRHAAYADYLIEQGDPRGEYIRLQLALEDRAQPADRLRSLEQQAFELRQRHEREWLGPLAEFVLPDRGPSVGAMVADPPVAVTWRRGWINRVDVRVYDEKVRDALCHATYADLNDELSIRLSMSDVSIVPLLQRPVCRCARRLRFGEGPSVEGVRPAVVGDMDGGAPYLARLEELFITASAVRDGFLSAPLFRAAHHRLATLQIEAFQKLDFEALGHNRSLGRLSRLVLRAHWDHVYREDDIELVPWGELRTLFQSPHLQSLTHLTLMAPGFCDMGVDELVDSGLIRRLKTLDLSLCDITDDGARRLAACPDVPKLESLRLDRNYISPAGADDLHKVGVMIEPSFPDLA